MCDCWVVLIRSSFLFFFSYEVNGKHVGRKGHSKKGFKKGRKGGIEQARNTPTSTLFDNHEKEKPKP